VLKLLRNKMKLISEKEIDAAWIESLKVWDNPSVPYPIVVSSQAEAEQLGKIGQVLKGELALMKYPEFQIYLNLERIASSFSDPHKAIRTILRHEIGHNFCPYDITTSILLRHVIKRKLEEKQGKYDLNTATNLVLTLFSDMCVNTLLVRKGDENVIWEYQAVHETEEERKRTLWGVHRRSLELAWETKILPLDFKLSRLQERAAQGLAALFSGNFFDRTKWKDYAVAYADIVKGFLEEERTAFFGSSDASLNIPEKLEGKIEKELAKTLAEIGTEGLPGNSEVLKEFQEILRDYGIENIIQASINFYDGLSDSYDVIFAARPFGGAGSNPLRPKKWYPSMSADSMDVAYTILTGGRIIPGVTTYAWDQKRRQSRRGLEGTVSDLELYIDGSRSAPNPVEKSSLLVLAGFVVSKKVYRSGARLRSTVFSGEGQSVTQDWTRELYSIFENLTKYYGGNSYFPTEKLLEGNEPRQVIIITDAFLHNREETADAIRAFIRRNGRNKVSVYALHELDEANYLREAGAEVISGNTTEVFRNIIGGADELYKI